MWTFRLLHGHLEKKYGVVVAYSTAAKSFNEMGIRLKVPAPRIQGRQVRGAARIPEGAREEIEEAAKADYHTVFSDEGHAQDYKSGRETTGLRGVEVVRTLSVGRARLSMFVAVGYRRVFVM